MEWLSALGLAPTPASTAAGTIDGLYVYLIAVTGLISATVIVLIAWFALRYRRRHEAKAGVPVPAPPALEFGWTAGAALLALTMFGWGALAYIDAAEPQDGALEIYVVGKRWMWQVHHQEGVSEINALHVPAGRPVRLVLASQDVIHSVFIPAFRAKADVVPGRYRDLWFTATRTGRYPLVCAEFCGTQHSAMIGEVVVLTPAAYQQWLAERSDEPLAARGEALFDRLACGSCHEPGPSARGTALAGLHGRQVQLASGDTVVADAAYIRESILVPQRRLVAGYGPVMPTYQGQVSEQDVLALTAYIRALDAGAGGRGASD